MNETIETIEINLPANQYDNDELRAEISQALADTYPDADIQIVTSAVDPTRARAWNADGEPVDSQAIGLVVTKTIQAVLEKIARTHEDNYVRAAAARSITDQDVLAEIVRTDEDNYVRKVAVRSITAQAVLDNIARTNSNWLVRAEAVRSITDQAVLAERACTDEDWYVRKVAALSITAQEVLEEIVRTDSDPRVRYAAKARLEALHAQCTPNARRVQ